MSCRLLLRYGVGMGTKDVIEAAGRTLAAVATDPVKIVLFGSRARDSHARQATRSKRSWLRQAESQAKTGSAGRRSKLDRTWRRISELHAQRIVAAGPPHTRT